MGSILSYLINHTRTIAYILLAVIVVVLLAMMNHYRNKVQDLTAQAVQLQQALDASQATAASYNAQLTSKEKEIAAVNGMLTKCYDTAKIRDSETQEIDTIINKYPTVEGPETIKEKVKSEPSTNICKDCVDFINRMFKLVP